MEGAITGSCCPILYNYYRGRDEVEESFPGMKLWSWYHRGRSNGTFMYLGHLRLKLDVISNKTSTISSNYLSRSSGPSLPSMAS